MNKKIGLISMIAGIIMIGTLCRGSAETTASRPKVFLSRQAVVKEEGGRIDLAVKAGNISPVIDIRTNGFVHNADFQYADLAAGVLTNFIYKIAGVSCAVQKGRAPSSAPARIVLGFDKPLADEFPELKQADNQGFLLKARKNQEQLELRIVSRTGVGTLYGAWFFLMNYAGLRIVMPGELGEVYEQQETLSIPAELYVFNPGPDFILRVWSGANGFDRYAWLGDTENSQRIEYHHNFFNIYPPEKYAVSHPEYYPIWGGKRYIPPTKAQGGDWADHWQPTLSDPATVARAVEYADEYFKKYPWKMSMSLGANDGYDWSDLDLQKARELPGGGTLSDIYYQYVNEVARQVAKKWPDKYVCCFGDYLALRRPAFKMEPNVMVVLVNSSKEPLLLLKEWKGQARQFVVYQWAYGDEWVFPNHWPHAIKDYLKEAHQAGCRAFKAENYAAWVADGPKWWVANNVLWNIDADVDGLLKDYYEHAYGKDAAPAMARYFETAEQIYERRRTPEEYQIVMRDKGYNIGEGQFRDVRAGDWEKMGQALEDAFKTAKGEKNRRRIELTRKRYEFGKLYWEQYAKLKYLSDDGRVTSDEDVAKVINTAREFYEIPVKRAQYFREQIEPYPQYCYMPPGAHLQHPPPPGTWYMDPTFKWSDWNKSLLKGFNAVTEYKKTGQKPADILAFWAETAMKNDLLKIPAAMQRLRVLSPAKLFAETASDLTYGAMVNLQAINKLAERGVGPVTPEDVKAAVAKVRSANEADGMTAELLKNGQFVAEPYAGKILVCNRLSTLPKLDGKPDDVAWKETPVYSEFYKAGTTNPANFRTELRLMHDGSNLYVCARCYQDTNTIRVITVKRDENVWHDDGVEMMLNAPEAGKSEERFQVIVNPKGNMFDYLNGSEKWNGHIQTAAAMLDDGYCIEISVPLAEIGVEPGKQRFWRFNFVRNVMGLDREISQWYSARYGNVDVRSRGWLIFN